MARATRQVRFEFEGDLSQLESELKKIPGATKKQIDEARKILAKQVEFEGMRKELGELPGVSRAAATKMVRELNRVPKEVRTKFAGLGDLITAELAADAIGSGVTSLKDYVVGVQEAREETLKFAEVTGIGTDTLAGLQLAVERNGGSFDEVRDSLADFGEVIFDASKGGGRAIEAFQGMDIALKNADGTIRKTDDVLKEVLKKLPQVANDSERVAFAQMIASDAGLEFANALEKIPLDAAIADARELSLVIEGDVLQSTQNWTAANNLLRESFLDLQQEASFLPSVGDIMLSLAVTADFFKNVTVNALGGIMTKLRSFRDAWVEAFQGDLIGSFNASRGMMLDFTNLMGGIDDAAQETADRFADVSGAAAKMNKELAGPAGFVGPEMDAAELAKRARAEEKKLSKARAAAAKARRAQQAEDRKAEQARKKAIEDQVKGLERRFAAEERLIDVTRAANDDIISDERRIQNELAERLNAIGEIQNAIGETAQTQQAIDAANARAARDFADLRIKQEGEVADAAKRAQESIRNEIEQTLSDARALMGATLGQALSSASTMQGLAVDQFNEAADEAQAQIDVIQENLEAAQGASAEQREEVRAQMKEAKKAGDSDRADALQRSLDAIKKEEQARDRQAGKEQKLLKKQRNQEHRFAVQAFERQQDLQRAEATMSAAVLGVEIATQLASFMGPAAIPVAIASAGAFLTTQLALIGAQKPPEMHIGGLVRASPDEVSRTMQTGEGALNRRAMGDMGEDELNARNSGRSGPRMLTVNIMLDRRVIQSELRRIGNEKVVSLGIGPRSFRRSAYQGQGI